MKQIVGEVLKQQEVSSRPLNILILTSDNPVVREIARLLLELGHQVKAIGASEKVLGILKSRANFQFHKFNLEKQAIIRSYLYGVDHIIFLDRDTKFIEKISHLYQSLEHLKSKPPGLIFLSSSMVFSDLNPGINKETSPLNPLNQQGFDFSVAEEIVTNYSKNLQAKVGIIRTPPFWDRTLVEEPFAKFIRLLRHHKCLSIIKKQPITLQWLAIQDLFKLLQVVLETQWSGLEIFHCYSHSVSLTKAMDEICSSMGSKSQIRKISNVPPFIQTLLSDSQTLREGLESIMKWEDASFLYNPPLEMEQTLHLIPKPDLKIGPFIRSLVKK